jgi:CMP-N-acetylneuraminic acid synthetase
MKANPSMRCYAIIPARGGSKGIIGKNLQTIGGVSLIGRAVSAARLARHVDAVFVSTDDDAIAAEARAHGAEIVVRPPELCVDEASSESALIHAVGDIAKRGLPSPDIIVFIQCTTPFLEPGDVDGTIEALLREDADSAFTAAEVHVFIWETGETGAHGVNHDKLVRQRRQDRPRQFQETGSLYALRVPGFLASGHRFWGKTAFYEVPKSRAIDIDDAADLEVARAMDAVIRAGKAEKVQGEKE